MVEVTGPDHAAGKEDVGFAFISGALRGPLSGLYLFPRARPARSSCRSLPLLVKEFWGVYHVTGTGLPFVLKPDFIRQK